MINFLLDFLFPKKCLGCGTDGSLFCRDCFKKIEYANPAFVRLAGSPLSGIITVAKFKNPLKDAIHILKYEKVRELAEILSKLLIDELKKPGNEFLLDWIFVPVPLSNLKEKERGFNQLALLLYEVNKKRPIKILTNCLTKSKNTRPQMQLKKEERLKNLRGAFVIRNKNAVSGKNIVLVDDVMTTGATLIECAKVLRRAGAKKIYGLVLAK